MLQNIILSLESANQLPSYILILLPGLTHKDVARWGEGAPRILNSCILGTRCDDKVQGNVTFIETVWTFPILVIPQLQGAGCGRAMSNSMLSDISRLGQMI